MFFLSKLLNIFCISANPFIYDKPIKTFIKLVNDHFPMKGGKIKLSVLLLIAFVIFGFYLRIYHLDFPAIGYHNMKENEYLDQAVFFMEEGNWLHKRAFAFYGLDEGLAYHEEYGQAPLIPYITAFLWNIFGEQLRVPRLMMIFFMLGSILLTYFVVKKLAKSEFLALLSSFLLTIMPLGIYFGRNVQPEAPPLFFILLGTYFYLNWIDTFDRKQLLFSCLSLAVAALFKYTFLIVLIPFAFIFPYKKFFALFNKNRKESLKQVLYAFIGFIPFIALMMLFEMTLVDKSKRVYDVDLFRIFAGDYWASGLPSIKSYIADNFTWWFFWFAVAGIVLLAMKHRTKLSKFMIGYAISLIPYAMIVSSKIRGHAYYQMPFLPLICIASAYFIFTIGSIIRQVSGIKYSQYIAILLIVLTWGSLTAANARVFDTIFFGQDVFGDYISARTEPGDRMFAFAHSQSLAVCSYAKRRCGWVSTEDEMQHKEEVFNIKYAYVDAGRFNKLQSDEEPFAYIRENYNVALAGFIKLGDQPTLTGILLEKGEPLNLSQIQNKPATLAKKYTVTRGEVEFYTIEN